MRPISLLTMAVLLAACAGTPKIPGGIAEVQDLRLNGFQQRVWVRGESARNPVLLVLHGGPGLSETALFRHYDAALERDFTVVYWDQRGTGRSYSRRLRASDLSVEKMLGDVDALIAWIKARLGVSRVVLLGHSWGSLLGLRYAERHPENVAAYVGVGQIVDMPRGEEMSYRFTLEEARRRDDRAAIRELEKIGPPPHELDEVYVQRRWLTELGGAFGPDRTQSQLLWAALSEKEFGLVDMSLFGRGLKFSLRALWPQLREYRLTQTRFAVPVFFFLGARDHQVPAPLAEEYFKKIESPCKKLVWFERSGHYLPFEEPEKFMRVMREDVRPALECRAPEKQAVVAGQGLLSPAPARVMTR